VPRDFAFIQIAPDRLFVGWGPFEQLPFRLPERPAFYVTDFFLDEPHPWHHPAVWEELSIDELASRITGTTAPEIAWSAPVHHDFQRLLESAHAAMDRGEFQKIVPVLFEHGRLANGGDHWRFLLSRLATVPPGMLAYGYAHQNRGLIGASPELLFRGIPRGYRTMALAGTRTVSRASELLHDVKELREHRFVVDDIVRRLAPFGNVEVGTLGVMSLPGIAHLVTPIFFAESGGGERMTFTEMVRRLHPTAALGVSPRSDAGMRWMREADRGVERRIFGAPFGLEREDGTALAIVAIRNVQWSGETMRIGAGAGVLRESVLDRELEELRQKREQVKALFGIEAYVPA
jgi:menaquinone-specific isochorismate synthase